MGRLTTLKSRIGNLPPRLGHVSGDEKARLKERDSTVSWRAWYGLERWKRLRKKVWLRDLYTCQKTGVLCIGVYPAPNSPVADHKIPHRGDPALFWDENNIHTVSKEYHDSEKQSQEKRARGLNSHEGKPSGAMARPLWFRKTYVPLTIVCGPPGSGKSTYVRRHAASSDMVVCFDQIATEMFGRQEGARTQARLSVDQIADVLRRRNDMLGSLMRVSAREEWRRAWLIVTEPRAEHRQWWRDTTGANVIVLATPAHECLRRIRADADAGDVRGEEASKFVNGWWSEYRPALCDQTVEATPS